jgi:phage tail sheath protein FI
MATYRVPGVYIEESSSLPPTIVEVGSAIPAFVGYTVKAANATPDDLRFKPTLVRSMVDFVEFFGDSGTDGAVVHMSDAAGAPVVERVEGPTTYNPLYFALQLYFDNGGRQCYVTSVGSRSDTASVGLAELTHGVESVAGEDEVTLIVVPEASSLSAGDYAALAASILSQCAARRDRFAIFDMLDGANPNADVNGARSSFPSGDEARYGAVYYPDLRTTLTYPYVESTAPDGSVSSNALARVNGGDPIDVASLPRTRNATAYTIAVAALRALPVVIPPSGAVAGAYVRSDLERGVWKAPASMALSSVLAPAVTLTQQQSDRLSVDPVAGKSVNVIRAMTGKGTLIWGARTLAGNDAEWKYVPIRRLFMVLAESIGKGTQWVVFEPNDANTWVKVRGVVENYLTQKWKQGALMGTTTREAFYVRCGLGETMTAQDVADGRLIIEVGAAPVRPAEFIVFRIAHRKMGSDS